MEDIKFVKVTFDTTYEAKYINGTPHHASKTESYFLSEDEYNKVIDFINNLKRD